MSNSTKWCINPNCSQANPQPLTEFHKKKSTKDGLKSSCKHCCNVKNSIYYSLHREERMVYQSLYVLKHKEKVSACKAAYREKHKKEMATHQAEYRMLNKEKLSIQNTIYREKHKEELAIQRAEYRKKERDKISIQRKQHYIKNKSAILDKQRNYREQNKEKITIRKSDYQKNKPNVVNANNAKRRANKIMATPNWLTTEQNAKIKEIYTEAFNKSKETGISHHVDHITPLQGKNVCGLHVPWNLQILMAKENISKGNKMPLKTIDK